MMPNHVVQFTIKILYVNYTDFPLSLTEYIGTHKILIQYQILGLSVEIIIAKSELQDR